MSYEALWDIQIEINENAVRLFRHIIDDVKFNRICLIIIGIWLTYLTYKIYKINKTDKHAENKPKIPSDKYN